MLKWLEKLKLFTKDKKGKRKIENLVIFLILGVIIIIVASSFFDGDKKENKSGTQTDILPAAKESDEILNLEERLEQILQEIEGVGYVKVMITGLSDGEAVYAYNEAEESSTQEQINESKILNRANEARVEKELVFMDGSSGQRIPVEIKRIKPEIIGVVVVADGGGSSTVRGNIISAIQALVEIPPHRIQVLKRK